MVKIKHRFIKFVFSVLIIAAIVIVALFIAFKSYYKLEYQEYIQDAAEEYQVNPYWITAMIKCESNFNSNAKSHVGAVGLMQLLPETAYDMAKAGLIDSDLYDYENLYDPKTNINYGTVYIRLLVERYHEMDPAIAAYNAGMANVDDWLDNDSDVRNSVQFDETDSYLKRVKTAKWFYERLYPDAFDWE